jgi:hypothetical protein
VSHPAAWQPDPTGKHDHRWWDGERWTEHVADAGQASVDPIEGAAPAPPGESPTAAAGPEAGGDAGGGWVGTSGGGEGGTDRGASGLAGGRPSDTGEAGGTTQPIWSQPGQQGSGGQGGEPQGWQGGQQPGAQGWQGGQQQGWQGDQQQGWQGGPGQGQPWQGGTPTDSGGGPGWQQGGGQGWQQGGGSPGTDGVAVAAMIVGILAILVSWIPVLGAIGGIAALVLGLVGRSRIKKRGASGNGMAVTGIATGAVAIAINIAILAFFVIAGGDFFDEVSTYVECVEETGDEAECQRRMNEGLLERFGQ